MGKIPVRELIAIFQRMYTEHWAYKSNAARAGCVDCSGAFVWAYKQFGASIAHGSNAIARSYVLALLPVSEAQPGMAAFKIRRPGDEKYKLPEKYQSGGSAYNGDLNDYYHIGLVDTDARYVLNAQSTATGFQRSKFAQTWACVGYLKAVDYGNPQEDESKMQDYVVVADSGKTVRVRKQPTKKADVAGTVRVNTVIKGEPIDEGAWYRVQSGSLSGYMMGNFLRPMPEIPADGSAPQVIVQPSNAILSGGELARLCELRDECARMAVELDAMAQAVRAYRDNLADICGEG